MKTKLSIFIAVLAFAVAIPGLAGPVSWQLDSAHSTVGFSVKHLGISKVRGRFTEVEATIKAGAADGRITAVEAVVDVASVDTGIGKRDDHLRSPDFFDAAAFPKIELKTRNIKWKGDKLSGVADLTIKGRTRAVAFSGEYLGSQKVNFGAGDQLRAGYVVLAKIDRQDFGLAFNGMVEGVAVVSDEVRIELEVEIVRDL